MHAIRTSAAKDTYRGEGIGPECADLPCQILAHPNQMIATYAFTDEERRKIAAGATIDLVIWQAPIPPIAIGLTEDDVVEQWLPTDLRCENEECRSVWLDNRGLESCGHCGGKLSPAMLAT